MKQTLKVMGFTALVALLVAGQACAQGQRGAGTGGQRRGGGMGGGMYVEQSWAVLSFEVKISADQAAKLKPTYEWAWKTRNYTLKTAMQKRDFQAVGSTMEKVKKAIDTAISRVLTKQQMATWQKWQKDQEAQRAKMRQAWGGMRPSGQGGQGGAKH